MTSRGGGKPLFASLDQGQVVQKHLSSSACASEYFYRNTLSWLTVKLRSCNRLESGFINRHRFEIELLQICRQLPERLVSVS